MFPPAASESPSTHHLKYWKLSQEPFSLVLHWSEEKRLLFRSRSWLEATARIQYVAENQFGLAILSGQDGVGKSLLLSASCDQLADQQTKPLLHVCEPDSIHEDFPFGKPLDAETRQMLSFGNPEQQSQLPGKRYALFLDNIEQVIEHPQSLKQLIGSLLHRRELGCAVLSIRCDQAAMLYERLSTFAPLMIPLTPFDQEETELYLQHRLQQSGGIPSLFTDQAAEIIYQETAGIARQINHLAHESLALAAMKKLPVINAELVSEVAARHSYAAA